MNKSMIKCHQRYLLLTNEASKLCKWSHAEDKILTDFVLEKPKKRKINWKRLSELLPGRLPKQIRERWLYQLDPSIDKRKFSNEEDIKIVTLYEQIGSRWTQLSAHLTNRNDNQVKNRFHQNLKKRIRAGEFAEIAPKLTAHF